MFGNTLLIANPAARSGKSAEATALATATFERMRDRVSDPSKITVTYTVEARHATRIASEEGAKYDTVIALGGDGIVHEVVNGLMNVPCTDRPALALIPCGNGDDFARTIGMERDPRKSLDQFENGTFSKTSIDVGYVNGEWFAETLSFGLDAAIALGTQELRKTTNRTGTSLYVQCGLDQLINHRVERRMTLALDDGEPQEIGCYLLAVQNGNYYGGGFRICPKARLDDGLLDICYATPELSALAATRLFLSAKSGKHVKHPNIHFERARKIQLNLQEALPTQIDGETLHGTEFTIELHPKELNVIMPL